MIYKYLLHFEQREEWWRERKKTRIKERKKSRKKHINIFFLFASLHTTIIWVLCRCRSMLPPILAIESLHHSFVNAPLCSQCFLPSCTPWPPSAGRTNRLSVWWIEHLLNINPIDHVQSKAALLSWVPSASTVPESLCVTEEDSGNVPGVEMADRKVLSLARESHYERKVLVHGGVESNTINMSALTLRSDCIQMYGRNFLQAFFQNFFDQSSGCSKRL